MKGNLCPGARNGEGWENIQKIHQANENLKAVATYLKIDGLRTEQMMLACKRMLSCSSFASGTTTWTMMEVIRSGGILVHWKGEPTGFEEINIDGNIRAKGKVFNLSICGRMKLPLLRWGRLQAGGVGLKSGV